MPSQMANLPGAWPLLKPLLTDILPDGFVTFQFFFLSLCRTVAIPVYAKPQISYQEVKHIIIIIFFSRLLLLEVEVHCSVHVVVCCTACLYCHPITLKHLVIFTPSIHALPPSLPFNAFYRGYHKSRVEKNPNFGLQPQ